MNGRYPKIILCLVICLLTAVLLCGCSYGARMANTAKPFSAVPVTAGQKEAQYMSYLEEQIRTSLETMSSVDTAEVSIVRNEADKPAVNVMLTLSGSVEKSKYSTEFIEEALSKFFEEEIDLTIELQ